MPYKLHKKDNKFQVTGPKGKVYSKGTTKAKADRQLRLLRAVEHGWKPTGEPAKESLHLTAPGERQAAYRIIEPKLMESTAADMGFNDAVARIGELKASGKDRLDLGKHDDFYFPFDDDQEMNSNYLAGWREAMGPNYDLVEIGDDVVMATRPAAKAAAHQSDAMLGNNGKG